MKHLLFVVLAVALSGCATPPRQRANLAIDDEPSALPERNTESTAATPTDERPSEEPIDFGFEGSQGRVRVEAAMSPEEEEAALRDDSEDEEEDSEDEDAEEGEPEE